MTQPAPPLDLDTIQARHQAATGGTWYLQPKYGPDFVASELAGYEHGIGTLDFGDGDQADADREFVLNAHTDMGALIARVRELEQQLAAAQANPLTDWADELTADNLEPFDGAITLNGDDVPFVRIHVAFRSDMNDDVRTEFLMKLGKAITDEL